MKNQLVLLSLFCLVLFSCKEDEDMQPSIKQTLQGTWEMPTLRDTYYDGYDKLVYESVYELNAEITFYGDSIRNSFPEEDEHYYNTFSIYQKDGKHYLRVGNDLAYGDSEVRTITATQVDLREDIRHNDVKYHDGTEWKKAKRRETIRVITKK